MTRYHPAAFYAGFSLMVVELTSSRIVAPIIGASIFTWTAIIGVTLLGLSIGGVSGGYIADAYYKRFGDALLGAALFISAIFVALIVPLSHSSGFIIENISSISTISTLLSVFLFLLPSIALGTVQPIILRLYTHSFEKVGREYGILSSLWSLGGIIGVFATGFYFIAHLGSATTLYAVAAILLILSAYVSRSWKGTLGLLVFGFLCISPLYAHSSDLSKNPDVIYDAETGYYRARVVDHDFSSASGDTRWLFLDFDSDSIQTEHPIGMYTDMAPVLKVFSDLAGHPLQSVHFIGAGAYILPKSFRSLLPDADISVSEVDPALIDIGNTYFDLARYHVDTDVGDARVFFATHPEKYDLIFGDAFNSFISPPWHLMTREFIAAVSSHLSEGGFYAMNIISPIEGEDAGMFYSEYETLHESFPTLYVFAFGGVPNKTQNIVIVGTKGSPLPYEDIQKALKDSGNDDFAEKLLPPERVSEIERAAASYRPLTDDFAPVENLMLPVMSDSFEPYLKIYEKMMD